jgi:DNA recombination protein RmuC
MSAVEMVLAAGLAAVIVLLVVLLGRLRGNGPAELSWLRQSIADHGESLAQIRERLAASSQASGDLQSGLGQARALLERMTAQDETDRRARERAQETLSRIQATLIGSYAKGRAGENVVAEALACFPAEMLQRDVALGGKRVEFALVMGDGRLLPIDSKWPSTDLLERLAQTEDPEAQRQLNDEIEAQVVKRVREVAGYIDAERTLPWAVAAVPEAVFAACRRAHAQAHERGVIVVPYGLLVPYLLTVYHLHLRYASGADAAQTQARLVEMARLLDNLERTLEGKLYRANTMLANACSECGQFVAAMRTSLSGALAAAGDTEDAARPPGATENP